MEGKREVESERGGETEVGTQGWESKRTEEGRCGVRGVGMGKGD